jgi:hypothetical protein
MASRIPHASFIASFQADAEYPHPPGAHLARQLEVALSATAADNWRDIGWRVEVARGEKQIEVYFAPFGAEGSWLLGIAPLGQPGFFAQLFGRKRIPHEKELKELSEAIHALLLKCSASNIQWMFGGPPGKVPAVSRPDQLEWHIAL